MLDRDLSGQDDLVDVFLINITALVGVLLPPQTYRGVYFVLQEVPVPSDQHHL